MARTKQSSTIRSKKSQMDRARWGRNWRPKLKGLSSLNLEDTKKTISGSTENWRQGLGMGAIGTTLLVGAGTYFAGRFLLRYFRGHPEIGEFIASNYEHVKNRMRGSEEEMEPRH